MIKQKPDPEKMLKDYSALCASRIYLKLSDTPDDNKREVHEKLVREFQDDPVRQKLVELVAEKKFLETPINIASLVDDGVFAIKVNDVGAVNIQKFQSEKIFK